MNDANNGSKLYLYSITTVAILGACCSVTIRR